MSQVLSQIMKLLLRHLTGPDYDLRRGALIAVSKFRGQMASEVIFERYQSDNLEDYLALALRKLDPEKAARILVTALNDPHIEARLSAAEALAKQKCEASTNALTDAVEKYLIGEQGSEGTSLISEGALIGATKALGDIGDAMSLSLLRKLVIKERNPKIRASAVAVLGLHITDSMLPMFHPLLKDPDSRVRANAIEAVQNLNNSSIVGILQPYLYDTHQRVRANAAKAIWKYGDFEVTSTLKEMITGTDKKQQVSGIYAIGEIRIEALVKYLLGFLKDTDPDVRRNAVVALKKFGKKDFSSHLIPMLDDPVPEIRIQSIHAVIEVFKGTSISPILKRLSVESVGNVRSTIISQIGKIAGEDILGQLSGFLTDEDERVVSTTIEAMFRAKPQNPSPGTLLTLRGFLQSDNNRIKANAIIALWNWGWEEALQTLLELLSSNSIEQNRSGLFCLGEILAASAGKEESTAEKLEQALKEAVEEQGRGLKERANSLAGDRIKMLWERINAELKAEHFADAEPMLRNLLALSPKNQQALIAFGDICFKKDEISEAEKCFLTALEVNPNLVKAHYTLGQISHRRGEWEKSAKFLLTTIKLYPKLPQAYLLLSEALEFLDRLSETREILKRLQILAPQNSLVMQRLARIDFLMGAVGEAVALARNAAAMGSISAECQFIIAFGETMAGSHERGIDYFLTLISSLCSIKDARILSSITRMVKTAQEILSRRAEYKNPA